MESSFHNHPREQSKLATPGVGQPIDLRKVLSFSRCMELRIVINSCGPNLP